MTVLFRSFKDLGVVPERFKRLDMKLKASCKRVAAHGILAMNIDTETARLEDEGVILRGMQVLWMIKEKYRMDAKSAHLYGFNDMNKIKLVGDDLEGMITLWESTLANCAAKLDEETVLFPMLKELVEDYPPLAPSMVAFNMMDPEDPNRSYGFILNACHKLINKNTTEHNRKKAQQALEKSATKERTASPPPKSGPRLPISQVQCMFEKNGACRAGEKCKFMHSENKAAAGTER